MIIDKSVETYCRELLTYYHNKDFANAEDLAKLIIKKFPKNTLSWQILSFIYLEKGKIKDAYETISNANQIDPEDYKVLINLGLILFKLGLYEKSISKFKKVLEINKDNFSAYINLGAVYQKINDLKSAEFQMHQLFTII